MLSRLVSKCYTFMLACLMMTGMAMGMTGCGNSVNKDMVEIPGQNIMMLKTEVTQGLYESVMGENPSEFKDTNNPVEMVSWYDAIYFCNRLSEKNGLKPVYALNGETDVTKWNYTPHQGDDLDGKVTQNTQADGYRLPTSYEWEYAARGGEDYRYAGSNDVDEVAWYNKNSGKKTHPVAQKKANGYGLYDMSGNVWEWGWDFNPLSGSLRIIRGGGWRENDEACGVNCLGYGCVWNQSKNLVGLRIVCSAK